MKFTVAAAAVASFTGLASATFPIPSLPICEAPVTSVMCTFTPIVPTPRHFHCLGKGQVTNPHFVTGQGCWASDYNNCRDFCLDIDECKSFGFNESTQTCHMYTRGLVQQKWIDRKTDHGWTYSNKRHCYTRQCPFGFDPKFPSGIIPKE